jgi:hypothetical protein
MAVATAQFSGKSSAGYFARFDYYKGKLGPGPGHEPPSSRVFPESISSGILFYATGFIDRPCSFKGKVLDFSKCQDRSINQ